MTLCEHCQYRPVRERTYQGGRPPRYCSDRCNFAANHKRQKEKVRDLVNHVRSLMGLQPDGGDQLTVPELEAIVRRLRRVLPYDGLAMHKPRHSTGKSQRSPSSSPQGESGDVAA